jgi:hypothetical protein
MSLWWLLPLALVALFFTAPGKRKGPSITRRFKRPVEKGLEPDALEYDFLGVEDRKE